MIFVARVPEPSILVKNAVKWTGDYLLAIKQLHSAPNDPKLKKAKTKAEARYKQKAIRTALGEKMFQGKCAYCESRIAHDQDPPIEHFRPKSAYPKLCFAWKNLLWACGKCNGTEFKGDKFPLKVEGGPILDPTFDQPNKHIVFEYDDEAGLAFIGFKTRRGETTRDTLGLNRRELLEYRSEQVLKLFYIATKAANGDPKAILIIQKSCLPSSEYTAFARTIADRFAIPWRP